MTSKNLLICALIQAKQPSVSPVDDDDDSCTVLGHGILMTVYTTTHCRSIAHTTYYYSRYKHRRESAAKFRAFSNRNPFRNKTDHVVFRNDDGGSGGGACFHFQIKNRKWIRKFKLRESESGFKAKTI